MDFQQAFGHKTNIKKYNVYFILAICLVFVVMLSTAMLIDYRLIVVKQQNLSKEALKNPHTYFLRTWMIRYLLNVVLVIIFAIYTTLAMNRITVGYVYIGLWLVIWFGFAFGELILTKKITYPSIISIVLFVLVIISFYFIIKDISELKRSLRYQKMKKREYRF
ncbi:hypothetical protein [Mycoplasma mycoides]|uniref:hypothetical protein n=1 Tax=Mycoplasma mycoides TaxID=2102 RepID=UPI002240A76C|nr:hypothetical protein [Mycoplasma mycoides]QVK05373.1 hypothetical protein I7640_00850 [Mycoplasma mycoides subsp. capri]